MPVLTDIQETGLVTWLSYLLFEKKMVSRNFFKNFVYNVWIHHVSGSSDIYLHTTEYQFFIRGGVTKQFSEQPTLRYEFNVVCNVHHLERCI